MDGIIVINKPRDTTSNQVVQTIRRLFQGIKAGHSGTLDPIATGVLPVCLGKATRVAEYIVEYPKTYRAGVTLGVTTDTEDSTGCITGRHDVPCFEHKQIEEALMGYIGSIEQLPPLYSAVKYQGKPLYYWTRTGKAVPRQVRTADIYEIKLLKYSDKHAPQIEVEVKCSKGTYIRTLAADIGRDLACGAHLSSLVRLAVGPFKLENSLTLEKVKELAEKGLYEQMLQPMDSALVHFPKLQLSDDQVQFLKNGQTVSCGCLDKKDQCEKESMIRIYDKEDKFKAIAVYEASDHGGRLRTIKFLAS